MQSTLQLMAADSTNGYVSDGIGSTAMVAVDSVGPGGGEAAYVSNGDSLSWTHDCGAEATYLLVSVATDSGMRTFSCTYGGMAMTLLQSADSGSATTNDGFIALFGLANPPCGSNTVSVTGLQAVDLTTGGSISFSGAVSLGTINVAYSGTAGPASNGGYTSGGITVPSTTYGNLVAVFVGDGSGFGDDGTPFDSPAVTQWTDISDGLGALGGACGHQGAATSRSTGSAVTVSWSQVADWYAAIAVEVQAPPSPGLLIAIFP